MIQEFKDPLNPDWVQAENHGKACVPGKVKLEDEQQLLMCKCCMKPVKKDRISLCQNSKQLFVLGFGFPLFYSFVRCCIILLILLATSYSCLSVYQAIRINKSYCQSVKGNQQRIQCGFMVLVSRTDQFVSDEEAVIRLSSFIIQLMGLLYIRDFLKKKEQYFDERTCSISDYSLILNGLPERSGNARIIRQMVQAQYESDFQIEDIFLIPNYSQWRNLREKRQQYLKNYKELITSEQQNKQDALRIIKQQLIIIDKEIKKQTQKLFTQQNNDTLICDKAIIILSTEFQRINLSKNLEELPIQLWQKYFGSDSIKVQVNTNTPQPKQINWENFSISSTQLFFRGLISWIITIIFVGIVFLIFYYIMLAKTKNLLKTLEMEEMEENQLQTTKQAKTQAFILVYAAILSVILFNKLVMSTVLHKLTHFQHKRSSQSAQFSFGLKYSLGMFFTTALMTIAVEDFSFGNFFKHDFGVVEQETIMFLFNSFMIPLIWLINPYQLNVLLKRSMNFGRSDYTQIEANYLMQNVRYDMGKRYAQILQTIWFTFFYATLIPIGGLLALAGFILYYWVDKYNLLMRSSVSEFISGKLCLKAVKLLDFTLLLRSAGELLFDWQIRHEIHMFSVYTAVISVIYLLLPLNFLINYFNSQSFNIQYRSYSQGRKLFLDTYMSVHPVYAQQIRLKEIQKNNRQSIVKQILMNWMNKIK